MKISSIRDELIYYCWKRSDRIIICFDTHTSVDGKALVLAGELECKAVTVAEEQQYLMDYGELAAEALLADTVTRFGTIFWDEGRYTPEANASMSS